MARREQATAETGLALSPGAGLETTLLQLATELLNIPENEIDQGIELILSIIGGFSGADCSGVSEIDRKQGQLRELYTWERAGCFQRAGLTIDIDAVGLMDLFGDSEEPTLVSDSTTDPRLSEGMGGALAELGIRSLAWVPIFSDEHRISAVGFTSAQPIEWDADDVSLLRIAGRMISNLQSKSEADANLRETTSLLEEFAKSVEHHLFVWSPDPPRFLYSNRFEAELTGFPMEAFERNPRLYFDVVVPADRRAWREMTEAGQTRPAELQYRIRHADGTIRWFRTRVFPGTLEAGRPVHMTGLTEDITERVEAAREEERARSADTMLARVSAGLAAAPLGETTTAIVDALSEISEFAELERGQVYEFDRSRLTMREIARFQVAGAPIDQGGHTVSIREAPLLSERVLSGQVVRITDFVEELPATATTDREFLEQRGVRSCLLIPLISAAQSIGCMVLSTLSYSRSWQEEMVSRLKVAADLVATAVARRASDNRQQDSIEFERLITSLVSEFMNLPVSELGEGIDRAIETIAAHVGCDRAALFIVDEERDVGVLFRGWWAPGSAPIVVDNDRIELSAGSPYGEWIRSDDPYLLISAPELELLRPDASEALSRSRMGTIANVPMVINGQRIGWFSVGAALPRVSWDEAELRSMALAADALANMYSRHLNEVERQRHQRFEEILSNMAIDFIKRPISEIHDGIEEIVDRFGKFARCDRAAILLIDPEKRTASTYYEWVHWGVPAPITDFPVDDAPEFYRQLTGASGTWLMYVEDFPPSDHDAGAALDAIGIHTLLNCPIASDDQLFGYASIGYRHAWHRPLRGTEQILEIAAGIIANALARERLEQKALAQHTALARALRFGSLAQLATGIAHELNQPLTAIANYSRACIRWLQGTEVDPEAVAEVLGKVSDEAIRAGDIVRNLRSHVKGGPRERAPSSIREIVDHACSLVAGTGRDHGVEIGVEYEPNLPLVNVEPTEIEQVIINILQNAIDSLAADGVERRAVVISVCARGAFVEVGVADSGPGFGEADAAKLFDQFYTTKAGGLGLGLSISRELIESSGGTIRAESSPSGATFRVMLPAALPRHGARPQPADVRPRNAPR